MRRGKNMEKKEETKQIMKQINLKLTEKQINQLDELGEALGGVSKSNLIRMAIAELLIKYSELLEK